MGKEVLRLENVAKAFSGNYVLRNINFSVEEGEVRALVGENGAGKSTMIKIISGVLRANAGNVYLMGERSSFSSPKESLAAGISVMYQELDLLPALSVMENVFLGIEERTRCRTLDRKAMNGIVDRHLREMNLDIDRNARVGGLPIVMQQMVAAIKAMVREAKVVIMDEPSSSLTNKESHILFGLIRRLKRRGIAVIYVSHRLEEIFEICDSVTVLLNGEMVSTTPVAETTRDKVVREMIGKAVVETRLNHRDGYDAPVILEVEGISLGNVLRDVSFAVKRGEIYGILGLMGSGAVSLGKLMCGILHPTAGTMRIDGREVRFRTPASALRNSVAYVSDDRRAYGTFREMDVEKNSMISSFGKYLAFKPLLIVDGRRIRETFLAYVRRLGIRIGGCGQKIRFLSGGNQQKVLIARALICDTDIVVLSSPTKGIDVGAKFEIYQILLECARQGKTVIVVSQEITELVQICDRVLMLKQGRVLREYKEDTLSESLIYNELLS